MVSLRLILIHSDCKVIYLEDSAISFWTTGAWFFIVCIYTVKPAYNGHPWKMARWPLYTGRLLYTGQICRKYKATENLTVIYSRGDHYVQGCILIFFNQYNDSAWFSQSRINQIEHSGCLMSATLNPTVWTNSVLLLAYGHISKQNFVFQQGVASDCELN